VRLVGLFYAFLVTVLFSTRDNFVRWLAKGTSTPPAVAAASALVGGFVVILVVLGSRLRRTRWPDVAPFLGVGVLFGLSYVSLFEAHYRGRVTVVSPLVATESLFGVALTLVFLRHSEVVGRRLALGALLVVAGGALIGAYR